MRIPMEDWLRGCVYHDGRHGEVMLPTDKVLEIANYIQLTRTSLTDGMIELPPYDRKTESNSEKPNNYCDDCLYTDTCDSKEFFYACTSKATISKMEQVEDEPQTPMCETCRYDEPNNPKCDECIAGEDKPSNYEPQTERPTRCSECKVWRRCFKEKPSYNMIKSRCPIDEPQTERSE